eukprot:TRINITY_DN79249_c0_g1_i1.p1 TRINITY_DN79249_c0_g1~~TRINITY_DN79249_c0_g1_i1.p1  ORF type:complete len:650 (-),score=105.35 TRINITY_DN79249_c0_g1_i1:171-2120(-)
MAEARDAGPPLSEISFLLRHALKCLHDASGKVESLESLQGQLNLVRSYNTPVGDMGMMQTKPSRKPQAEGLSPPSDVCIFPRADEDLDGWFGNESPDPIWSQEVSSHTAGEQDSRVSSAATSERSAADNEKEEEQLPAVTPMRSTASQKSKLQARKTFSSTADDEDVFVAKTRKRGKVAMALWNFLEYPESSCPAQFYALMLSLLLQVSVILTALRTVEPPIFDEATFALLQTIVDLIFLVELLVRFCVCPSFSAFARSFYNITDFAAAALPLSLRAARTFGDGVDFDNGILRYLMFCAVPVLRELKILRRVQLFHLFNILLEDIREAIMLLMMLLVIVVLVFAGMLYAVEPEENLDSLPKAMYLTIVTVTTVGYGDITPKTTGGVMVTTLLTLFSILYTAMPIGIIGNAFTQIWQDRHRILLMLKTRDILVQSGYSARDLPEIFKEYAGGEGEDTALSFEKFLEMVDDMKLGIDEQKVIEVFESIDRDGGGSIDEQEFIRAVFPDEFHKIYARGSNNLSTDELIEAEAQQEDNREPEPRSASKESPADPPRRRRSVTNQRTTYVSNAPVDNSRETSDGKATHGRRTSWRSNASKTSSRSDTDRRTPGSDGELQGRRTSTSGRRRSARQAAGTHSEHSSLSDISDTMRV